MLNLQTLIEKVGLVAAVEICREKLPAGFIDNLSDTQYVELFRGGSSQVQLLAVKKLPERNLTFDQLEELCSASKGIVNGAVVMEMARRSQTFEQKRRVHSVAPRGSSYEVQAFADMERLAEDNFWLWKAVFDSTSDKKNRTHAESQMVRVGNRDDWKKLCMESCSSTEPHKLALDQLEKEQDEDFWLDICANVSNKQCPLYQLAVEKLRARLAA